MVSHPLTTLASVNNRVPRPGSQAGPPDPLSTAIVAPRRHRAICRAATAPPVPQERQASEGGSGGDPQQAAAGLAPLQVTTAVGTYPIAGSWLAYSRRLRSLPGSPVDILLEQLRWYEAGGDSWARLDVDSGDDVATDEEDLESESEDAAAAGAHSDSESEASRAAAWERAAESSSGGVAAAAATVPPAVQRRLRRIPRHRQLLEVVPSSRGARRINSLDAFSSSSSSSRRQCRGRPVAGAGALGPSTTHLRSQYSLLPEELQGCHAGELLSSEQEVLLAELVLAAEAAQRQLLGQALPAAAEEPEEAAAAPAADEATTTGSLNAAAADVAAASTSGQHVGQDQQEHGQAALPPASCLSRLPPRQLQTLPPPPALASQQQAQQAQQAQRLQVLQQQLLTLRRGVAARQLLFDCNLRLVAHAQRMLLGKGYLPSELLQELTNAGRDALWRAATSFKPTRHTRFSTYAISIILNALRDVMWQRTHGPLVNVSREARAWADQVQSAVSSLKKQPAAGDRQASSDPSPAPTQQQQEQEQPEQQQTQAEVRQQRGRPRRQPYQPAQPVPAVSDPTAGRLEQLAAAAQLHPRQVVAGLAAARRQRAVGSLTPVPVQVVEGAVCHNRRGVLLAPFKEIQEREEEYTEEDLEAVQHRVQVVLAGMQPPRHRARFRAALLMRFGLADADLALGDVAAGDVASVAELAAAEAAVVAELEAKGQGMQAGRAREGEGSDRVVGFGAMAERLEVSRQRAAQIYNKALTSARQAAASQTAASQAAAAKRGAAASASLTSS